MKINFTEPLITGYEKKYVYDSINQKKLSGDGKYALKCSDWFAENLGFNFNFLTPSCTASLEMAAILINAEPGDEIIMPSYTFVSTANAFVMHGCKIKFIDVNPLTMNIDENLILDAITKKTKAIVVVHYGGVACDMEKVMDIANSHNIYVIEDAAQALFCKYKDNNLGTIGHMATFSFHDTKNFNSGGEGGLLVVNDQNLFDRSEIIREKGTNRSNFLRGEIDKYTWVDKGSSFLMSEIQAAFLYAQIKNYKEFLEKRLSLWKCYQKFFRSSFFTPHVKIQSIPEYSEHNAHLFFIKLKDEYTKTSLIKYLKKNEIQASSHYVPLHNSPYGAKVGKFIGNDVYTSKNSECLLRMPLHNNLNIEDINMVCKMTESYFKS